MKTMLIAGMALAQVIGLPAPAADIPPEPAGIIGAASGTGAWPAVAEAVASLPTHTVYRPLDLPQGALPLVLWGNGACRDNGLQHAMFLREVASHGYLVIALGHPREERGIALSTPEPEPQAPAAAAAADETQYSQMSDAIAWAKAENERAGGPLHGKVDLDRIAVMGHSCGGLQAMAMSLDPRIKTTILFNSGIYNRPGPHNRTKLQLGKEALDSLHAPIAYFHGGDSDIAQPNADDDVARIRTVPVFLGILPVGHGGTFWKDENGGAWGQVASHWLDWRLKGDAEAGRWFSGAQCLLCTDPAWRVVRRGME